MKKFLLAGMLSLLSLNLVACDPAQDAIVQAFLGDLAAAQANFDAAGMVNEAKCMSDAQVKVQSLIAAAASTNTPLVNRGLVSLGSIVYIKAAQLRAQLAGQLQQGPNAISPACTEVVGAVTMAAGSMGLVVPNLPVLPTTK